MEVKGALNQKRLELIGVRSIKDIQFMDFFRNKPLDSKLIAVARLVGSALSESTSELTNPGGGDGGNSTMCGLAWSVVWASLLELVVVVVVPMDLVVDLVAFLGCMMGSEKMSSR